jgi:hypothetical protein
MLSIRYFRLQIKAVVRLMSKKVLCIFLLLLISIVLICLAWYTSYPLSVFSSNDYIFNHISILYWIGLPLLLVSNFLLIMQLKNEILKWVLTLGMFFGFFSIMYFYSSIWGIDSHWFRGLTDYFITSRDLDPAGVHGYFQWPSFFILASIVNMVSGLSIVQYEFIQFTAIGLILATAIYIYAFRFSKQGSILAVTSFFIVTFYFLNLQNVPFTLAFSLLLLVIAIEPYKNSKSGTIAIIILFSSITLGHAFVPLFYILYQSIVFIFNRNRLNGFILGTVTLIYISYLITFAYPFVSSSVNMLNNLTSEYSSIVTATLNPTTVPFDMFAQVFSRSVTLGIALLCGLGFLFMLFKRKTRQTDIVLLLVGLIYTGLGFFLYTLGSRGIPIFIIPLSLGVAYLYQTKLKKLTGLVFAVLLILSIFIIIHSSFADFPLMYIQTNQESNLDSFFLQNFNMTKNSRILSDVGPNAYLDPLIPSNVDIENVYANPYNATTIGYYNSVIYSIGFEKVSLEYGQSPKQIQDDLLYNFSVVYSSGDMFIAYKP